MPRPVTLDDTVTEVLRQVRTKQMKTAAPATIEDSSFSGRLHKLAALVRDLHPEPISYEDLHAVKRTLDDHS